MPCRSSVITGFQFVAGLILLVFGAELLVRGAARFATAAGITPLVVGLTVVAYGTSMPEAAVSIQAAHAGNADVAIGNIAGSIIFNVLGILGLSALVSPLTVSTQLVRSDVPISIGAAVLFLLFSLDRTLSRPEGFVLLALAAAYTIIVIRFGRAAARSAARETGPGNGIPDGTGSPLGNTAFVVAGLLLLLLGARWLVDSAVTVATALGVSPLVIGLTIVAAGTSLPELATSVAATARGQRDIAVGNVVGSNIFNILFVLGAASAFSPAGLAIATSALTFDIPVMLAVVAASLPIFFTGYRIERWEGAVFLGIYIAYTVYLVLHGFEHAAAPIMLEMALFVIPLIALTVVLIAWREWRRDRSAQAEH